MIIMQRFIISFFTFIYLINLKMLLMSVYFWLFVLDQLAVAVD